MIRDKQAAGKYGRAFILASVLLLILFLFSGVSSAVENKNSEIRKPVFDYFVMSFCPYSNQVEPVISELYSEFKGKVEFKPHYVIYEDSGHPLFSCLYPQNKSYCAMHGLNELYQDVREVCVKQEYGLGKYYKFITGVNEKCGQNVTCWKEIASDLRISIKKIERCAEENKFNILAKELSITNNFSVYGSPTFFINGELYEGVRTEEALKQEICNSFEKKPSICKLNLSGGK